MWIELSEKTDHTNDNRTGIHLRFYGEVSPEVKLMCKDFCKWLRNKYWFPIMCKIDIINVIWVTGKSGEKCASLYRYKDDINYGFRIRIAVGDYTKMIKKYNSLSVIGRYLFHIAHDLTHYFQWYFLELESAKRTKRSIENEATRWANYLRYEYCLDRKLIKE